MRRRRVALSILNGAIVASGPEPTSGGVNLCCGAARRTCRSLRLHNSELSELTLCGQGGFRHR